MFDLANIMERIDFYVIVLRRGDMIFGLRLTKSPCINQYVRREMFG